MDELILNARRLLLEFIANNNKPQSKIAREMGVSTATLSQFLSESYPGDNSEVARKALQLLEIGEARKNLIRSPSVNLSVSNTERILTEVKMAHIDNDILLVYGPAGCSKTTALKYYAEKVNGAVYVEADATTGSQRAIITLILEALGESTTRASTAQMMRMIISKVKGTNQLIIVDEAQHLTERAFDTLRAINDKGEIGIVFSGNPGILKRMFGRLEQEFDQVYSRVGGFCELYNRYSLEDIDGIFKNHMLDKECIRYLHQIANRKGGLRLMVKQYKLAANIATTLSQDISIPLLEEASRRMNVIRRIA